MKRLMIVACVLALTVPLAAKTQLETDSPLSKALNSLVVNTSQPIYVKSLKQMLQPTSLSNFGGNVSMPVSYESAEGWGKLSINGTEIESGSNYQFNYLNGATKYTFSVKRLDGSETVNLSLTFTSLPVVSISGSFSNAYSKGSIVVQEPDKPSYPVTNMKAKWRGGITNISGKHKRNYHVKLLNEDGEKLEQSFFGLRNDNSWILESCQVDMLRIRNRVLTDLWNDYATPPYYIDKEPKARTGTRGQFVELILNGEYRGIYCMTENMDRKQMKLMKYDEQTQTVHGQLWKSKDWSYAVFMGHYKDNDYYPFRAPMNYNNDSESWDQYYVKYPSIDDVKPTDWQVLYSAVRFVCSAGEADFKRQFKEYFDLPVVIDYYILMETILSTDNHGKNMFFAVYDKQQDKRITFGVWDMDATMGQRWNDSFYHWNGMMPEQDYATYITKNEHGDYNLFRRLRLADVDDFNMAVRMRYRDLRQTYLDTEQLKARFHKYIDEFKTAGAAQREYNRWSYDTDIERHQLNFDTELAYLDDWLTRRLNYLDKIRFKISELPASGITSVDIEATEPVNTRHGIYDLNGRLLNHDTSPEALRALPRGLYIVNGRKVVVGK